MSSPLFYLSDLTGQGHDLVSIDCSSWSPYELTIVQSLSSVETPTSRVPSPLNRPTRTPLPPSHGTSPATTPTLSVACTSTSSVTTPTAAHRLVLTVCPPVPSILPAVGIEVLIKDIVNPFGKTHGAPADEERHVGDLGNFKTDAQGNAVGSVQDKLIKLIGAESVLGVCNLL